MGPFGSAAVEEEERKGAEDEHVFAVADPAGSDGAEGGIDALVHVEVEQHRSEGFALAGVRGHGEGGRQWQLPADDLENFGLAVLVQVPLPPRRLDGVHAGLVDAVQLPQGTWELDVNNRWQAVVLGPDPGVDVAHAAAQ